MTERLIKYLKIIYRWIIGITIELIYPLIVFSTAAIICYLFYWAVLFKK